MQERRIASGGFTLIELLVVIAIIAIMSAALMPAVSSATDRARVSQCRANLTHTAMALRMYYDDWAAYPQALAALHQGQYITDETILQCVKTGTDFFYARPTAAMTGTSLIAACADPRTAEGQRPHGYRNTFVALQRAGRTVEVGK